jgi:sec-independent protein translocase protein TatA
VIGDIFQPTHLLFILVIALLVLGPKRLPEAGRSLGRGLRDFRNALSGEDHHHDEVAMEASAPPASTVAEPSASAGAPPTAPVQQTAAEPAPEQPAEDPVPEPAGAPAERIG